MKNNTCCAIGVAFIVAKFAIALNPWIRKESKEFIATLGPKQRLMYEMVKKERKNIYLYATIAGLLLGSFVLYSLGNKSNLTKACAFVSTVFVTQYFFYILSPKKYNMVNSLDNKEQVKEWQDVYREYQWSYHMGLVVGLVGYFLLGYGY